MLAFLKTKTAPSPYPRIPFHGVRCAQAASSLVVSAMMWYFIWNLVHEKWEPPKTFWTLLAASIMTIFFLVATTLVHVFFGLGPRVNLVANAILMALWAPGFGFLWYYTRRTLTHVCNEANWNEDVGIMVCRIYKALFAFSMLGFVSTFAALLLDIFILRRVTSRGKYSQMQGSVEANKSLAIPQYTDAGGSANQEEFRAQPSTSRPEGSGYEVPEEQFEYDTSYRGHEPTPAAH